MSDLAIDPKTTALVVIDLQKGIVAAATAPHSAVNVVQRAASLADACRTAGVAVILVHVDPGVNGLLFPRVQADKPRPPMTPPPDFAEIVSELGPKPGDAVVTKHQPNAFYATDLEVQLTRRGVRMIILCGIATQLGVEATARGAHERGYEQIFVEDATSSREEDLHRHAMTRILPTMGRVRSVEQVIRALQS